MGGASKAKRAGLGGGIKGLKEGIKQEQKQ